MMISDLLNVDLLLKIIGVSFCNIYRFADINTQHVVTYRIIVQRFCFTSFIHRISIAISFGFFINFYIAI